MPNYLDIEVSLDHIEPRIWRRFLLRDRATFLDLHHAIQHSCGWQNSHLFAFIDDAGDVVAGVPDGFGMSPPDPDAGKVKVRDHLVRHWAVNYVYDFGDSWEHTITLHEVATLDERFKQRLTGGARSFPPEDCGGVPGYLDVIAFATGGSPTWHDPDDLEWVGDWDPEYFDAARLARFFNQ